MRISFEGKGGIMDFSTGVLKLATKALFEEEEVFTKEENSDCYLLKKGADQLVVEEAGFLIGLATMWR